MAKWDKLYCNATIATCANGYGLIENGAIAVQGGKIAWVGRSGDLEKPEQLAHDVQDLAGKCITPGLIDCHTHLVYAGSRAHEFEQRLHGASYTDIAQAGGGILSTVRACRAASAETIAAESTQRLRALSASGVTRVEIKSGYGLDLATELKLLRVAKDLQAQMNIDVYCTFLGAHCVPPEYKQRANDYVQYICDTMIPAVAKEQLAHAVDVFCENIAFNLQQAEKVFQAAKQYGLQVKCHAEQLSASGAAELAARYQALSVDHLEFLQDQGVKTLAAAGTVAVLLPGAFYYLRETQLPPIAALREHGVPIAIASDCNPGTSPICSLLLIMNMACTLFRLTPEEALLGVTKHAAQALGIEATHGTLTTGKVADFVVWDVKHPVELIANLGTLPRMFSVKDGRERR